MIPDLGRLQSVPVKEIWQHEAHGFTPWLAKTENLNLLGEAIWLGDIELEDTEKRIGNFIADIVARDAEDRLVLIENQLGATDHGHLGQIITYLAGLDERAVIVWISAQVREDHRAAIDWLNRNTTVDHSFFAIELEAYKIGDSLPAPRFDVVARPNEWSKISSANTFNREMSERNKFYVTYWEAFHEVLAKKKSGLSITSAPKGYYNSFSIGKSGYSISAKAGRRDNYLAVECYLGGSHAKQTFDELQLSRREIEKSFDFDLHWMRMDEQKASRIFHQLNDVIVKDESNWQEQHDWLADKVVAFAECFTPRILSFEPPEHQLELEAAE